MKGFERRVIFLTMASHMLVHLFEQAFPPILKLVSRDYGLDLAGAGGLGNVFPFFFGLGGIPAGFIVDKWGSRRAMEVYLSGAAIAGVAVMFVKPLWGLGVLMFVMGVSTGLYHPAGLALISRNMSKVGTGLGLHGVGGNLGVALGPLFAATVAASFGWRSAYAVLAVPCVALSLWLLLDKSMGEGNPVISSGGESRAQNDGRGQEGPARISWPSIALLMVVGMLNGFCYRGMLTFMPVYFSEMFAPGSSSASIITGGGLTTAVLIIGVLGQYMGGKAADRWRSDILYAAAFTAATPLMFLLGKATGYGAVAAGVCFSFIYFANQPMGNKLLAQFTPKNYRGRAYGMFFFVTFSMGSFASTIGGWVGQTEGLSAIFTLLGAVLVCLSLGAWALVFMAAKK